MIKPGGRFVSSPRPLRARIFDWNSTLSGVNFCSKATNGGEKEGSRRRSQHVCLSCRQSCPMRVRLLLARRRQAALLIAQACVQQLLALKGLTVTAVPVALAAVCCACLARLGAVDEKLLGDAPAAVQKTTRGWQRQLTAAMLSDLVLCDLV